MAGRAILSASIGYGRDTPAITAAMESRRKARIQEEI